MTHTSVKSKGRSISLGYYGWKTGDISIFYKEDSYDQPLEQLQNAPQWMPRILNQNSLNTAWGFNKSQQGFTLNSYFERGYISFVWTETVLAVDGPVDTSMSVYHSIRGGYDLTKQWGVEFEIGLSGGIEYQTAEWTSAALTYRW